MMGLAVAHSPETSRLLQSQRSASMQLLQVLIALPQLSFRSSVNKRNRRGIFASRSVAAPFRSSVERNEAAVTIVLLGNNHYLPLDF
jgi:hypothetical protein